MDYELRESVQHNGETYLVITSDIHENRFSEQVWKMVLLEDERGKRQWVDSRDI